MKATRRGSKLVLMAILTFAVVAVLRAEVRVSNPTPYTQSVLRFLAAHQDADTLAASGVPKLLETWAARMVKAGTQGAGASVCQSMLPVIFIGLAAPLSLIDSSARSSLGRPSALLSLPCRFQRPPPSLLS